MFRVTKPVTLATAKAVAPGTSGKQDDVIVAANMSRKWSDGLIAAARHVAAATHSLIEAANSIVQGKASEEKLISAVKQVAGSTAQLLVACKVKSYNNSNAMRRVQTAGNAVKKATDNLVRSAQQSIEHDEEADKSLVVGVYKHGYDRFNLMRQDQALCFLQRCVPPVGTALLAEIIADDDPWSNLSEE